MQVGMRWIAWLPLALFLVGGAIWLFGYNAN